MNEMLEVISKRRSVRAYEDRLVAKDLIEMVIDAGNEAPSAMNSQPWRFVVIQDKEIKKKLLLSALPNAQKIVDTAKDTDPERYESIKKRYAELADPIFYSAPVIIFIIGSGPYATHSCPLACENMMLAAYSLGLGTCWVGLGSMVTSDTEIRVLLELKEGESIYGPILLGYPKEHPDRPTKKGPRIKWL